MNFNTQKEDIKALEATLRNKKKELSGILDKMKGLGEGDSEYGTLSHKAEVIGTSIERCKESLGELNQDLYAQLLQRDDHNTKWANMKDVKDISIKRDSLSEAPSKQSDKINLERMMQLANGKQDLDRSPEAGILNNKEFITHMGSGSLRLEDKFIRSYLLERAGAPTGSAGYASTSQVKSNAPLSRAQQIGINAVVQSELSNIEGINLFAGSVKSDGDFTTSEVTYNSHTPKALPMRSTLKLSLSKMNLGGGPYNADARNVTPSGQLAQAISNIL